MPHHDHGTSKHAAHTHTMPIHTRCSHTRRYHTRCIYIPHFFSRAHHVDDIYNTTNLEAQTTALTTLDRPKILNALQYIIKPIPPDETSSHETQALNTCTYSRLQIFIHIYFQIFVCVFFLKIAFRPTGIPTTGLNDCEQRPSSLRRVSSNYDLGFPVQ